MAKQNIEVFLMTKKEMQEISDRKAKEAMIQAIELQLARIEQIREQFGDAAADAEDIRLFGPECLRR